MFIFIIGSSFSIIHEFYLGEEELTDHSLVSPPHNGGHGRMNGDEGKLLSSLSEKVYMYWVTGELQVITST